MSDEYANGGYIPGGPVVVRLDPDECIVNIKGECTRPDHPTPASAALAKCKGFWKCEPR